MSAQVLNWSLTVSQLFLSLAMACAAYRMLRGPRAQDRVLGLDALYLNGMLLILTFGIRSGASSHRREVAARQDRGADAGERFFRGSAHQGGIAERKAMIDRKHDLSITKQAEVLQISRGSVYYQPRPVSSADIEIMRQLDRLHLEYPFAGSRMLRGLLAFCRGARSAAGM